MIQLLRILIVKDYKDQFPTTLSFLGSLFSVLLTLVIYWFTAKAIGPALKESAPGFFGDYFSFVVYGEVMLALVIMVFESVPWLVRASASDGTLEAYLVQPVAPQRVFILSTLAVIPRELSRAVLTLIIAATVFQIQGTIVGISAAFLFQLYSLPAFVGLGLLSSAILVRFGGGNSFISHATAAITVLAGAYFPLSVFPGALENLLLYISPFTALLDGIRHLLHTGIEHPNFLRDLIIISVWNLVAFPVGYWAFGGQLRQMKKKGAPLLFTS